MASLTGSSIASTLMSLVLAAGSVVGLSPSASAASCSVRNLRSGGIASGLQPAVDAAEDGDALQIRGVCVGTTVLQGRTLRLMGRPTTEQPSATLDGGGVGRVLEIHGGSVVIRDLDITDGVADDGGGIWLGGGAALHLGGTSAVYGNVADGLGGGFFVHTSFDNLVKLRGSASISDNTSAHGGGGIFFNYGTLILKDSASVSDNSASSRGGGIYSLRGKVSIKGSASITGNTAAGSGGGIWHDGWRMRIKGSASISDNRALEGNGGGIASYYSRVWLSGTASVTGNSSASFGGGIDAGKALMLSDSTSVSANTSGWGGGIDTGIAAVMLNDSSSVTGNAAANVGGGIYVGDVGSLTVNDSASVTANSAGRGGGIGLMPASHGPLALNGSASVAGNTAATDGGGIFFNDPRATFILSASAAVTGNVAGEEGGGIYSVGTLVLNDTTTVTGNTATTGGGIYEDDTPSNDGPVYVCSDLVAISPNDPDDPPQTLPCP